jgi:hypothetical protein
MSVSMTADAVIERRKTVTRRKGWRFLKAGDRLTLCRKVQGRKPGEPLVRLAEVEVVIAERQPLDLLVNPTIDPRWAIREMAREGFPGMDPWEFIERYFIASQRMQSDDDVTRIEWRYLDGEAVTR